jgi:hypothetical protein
MHFKRRVKSSPSIWPTARIAISGICAAAVIVGGVAIAGVSTASAAVNGPESFPNSAIATQAALWINQDISPKQCLEFALDMIHAAGGTQFYFGEDTSLYQGEWTSMVHAASIPTLADAQIGDIVQWPGGPNENPVPHTLIISSLATDPMQDMVIDDNFGNDDVVRTGTFASRLSGVGRSDYEIWRVGIADGGSPPPQPPPPPTQVAVTATVSSSTNPSSFGQPVTLTMTVAPQTSDANTPTGAVAMFDGSAEIGTGDLSGGTFSVTESSWSVGTHQITATYAGDSNFFGGTSSTFNQVVNKAATTTTVTSSANPSVFGQPVILTASVAPTSGVGSPTGTVQLFSGTTSIGSGTLSSGSFSVTQSSLPVGTYPITATYAGDSEFLPSNSAVLNQVVNKAPTHTSLVANQGGSVGFGHPVTFTATVSVPPPGAGDPSGALVFSVDGTAVQTVNLNASEQASVSTSALLPGDHLISATYQGDSDFLTSTGTLGYKVTCTFNVTGASTGALIASGDSTCVINGTVTGAIVVSPGTSLAVINSTVNGSINAPGEPGTVAVCRSKFVGGAVNISHAQGVVIIGDPGDANCPVNNISGALVLEGNSHGVEAIGNAAGTVVNVTNSGPGPYPGDSSLVTDNTTGAPTSDTTTTVAASTASTTTTPTTIATPSPASSPLTEPAATQAAGSAPPTPAPQTSPTRPPAKKLPPTNNPPSSTTPTVIDTRKRVDTAAGD